MLTDTDPFCAALLIFVTDSLSRLVTPATSFLNCACSFRWQVRQPASTYPAATATTHGPQVHSVWQIFSVCCPRDYSPRWNKGTNIMFCVGFSCLLQQRQCGGKGDCFSVCFSLCCFCVNFDQSDISPTDIFYFWLCGQTRFVKHFQACVWLL